MNLLARYLNLGQSGAELVLDIYSMDDLPKTNTTLIVNHIFRGLVVLLEVIVYPTGTSRRILHTRPINHCWGEGDLT